MVFAPICMSDFGEDFLTAATLAPAYFGTFLFEGSRHSFARGHAMLTPDATARQRGAHRNTTAHSWIAALPRQSRLKTNTMRRLNSAPINDHPRERTLRKSVQASVT
jgi:hypothetical protein